MAGRKPSAPPPARSAAPVTASAAPARRAERRRPPRPSGATPAARGGTQPVLPPGVPQHFVPGPRARARRRRARLPAHGPGRGHGALQRREGRDRPGRGDPRRDPGHGRGGAGELGGRDVARHPRRRPRDGARSARATGRRFPRRPRSPRATRAGAGTSAAWLYGQRRLDLLRDPASGAVSRPSESERDFRVRIREAARAERDERGGGASQEVRAQTRRARGAPPARPAGGGAGERAGHPAGRAGSHLLGATILGA